MEAEDEPGGHWDSAACTEYPLDLDLGDLHAVADAAKVREFVLAGYSGMAAQAGFLAVASDRATGLAIGGFPLRAGYDYWLGYFEGFRTALVQAGQQAKADDEQHLGILLYRTRAARDDAAALAALRGPKILWYGSRDGEPDCRMYDVVGGAAIARRIAAHADDLRQAGFTLIELDGYDHIGALAATEVIAPKLSAALAAAGC
jgi:hypothetical protein